jgi:hypothetical protein
MLPAAFVPFVARSERLLALLEAFGARVAASLHLPGPSGGGLAKAVHEIFGMRAAIALSLGFHLAGWMIAAVETWVALALAGRPLGMPEAIAVEALVFALRGAAFIVPSSVGVQEGGYVVVGALFGVGPEAALALSLLKRARDLVTGIPALLVWQAAEGQRFHRRLRERRTAS